MPGSEPLVTVLEHRGGNHTHTFKLSIQINSTTYRLFLTVAFTSGPWNSIQAKGTHDEEATQM